jgi:ABC-type transporter Mla subunit MlaD
MDAYLTRARTALIGFEAILTALEEAFPTAPSSQAPQARLDRLREVVARLRTFLSRLTAALGHIEATGLDVVDLQVRLQVESASLASGLTELEEAIGKIPGLIEGLEHPLADLEEAAQRVAAALFPNAVEGVREINRTLWDFRPLWIDYERTLAFVRTGRGGLTETQIDAVTRTAAALRARIDDVNDLLNQLTVSMPTDRVAIKALLRSARVALRDTARQAQSKAAERYKAFHGILKRAERLADKVFDQFFDIRVPVFPPAARLAEIDGLIDAATYAQLAGVERFALLNVTARLRSITFGEGNDDHLLSTRFGIRVFDVFPDRIYFTASAAFIDTIRTLEQQRVFVSAPASLHRFKTGSFKQRESRKGNVQVSYATGTPDAPGDTKRVSVDADIDLYRSPTKHLFGEVLVNHLTGSKTDQFKVWDTLASREIAPISGFDVVTA